jgi:phosphoenolpyruvate-protein kinase (PTS system EI component)
MNDMKTTLSTLNVFNLKLLSLADQLFIDRLNDDLNDRIDNIKAYSLNISELCNDSASLSNDELKTRLNSISDLLNKIFINYDYLWYENTNFCHKNTLHEIDSVLQLMCSCFESRTFMDYAQELANEIVEKAKLLFKY